MGISTTAPAAPLDMLPHFSFVKMRRLLPLVVLALLVLPLAGARVAHPFHSSIAEVEFNPQTQSLEVSVRLFTDDLEGALAAWKRLPKVNLADTAASRSLARDYVLAHFNINCGRGQWRYYGYEAEGDATWLHFELAGCGPCRTGTMTNSLMVARFDDQMNLVNFKQGQEKKSFLFNAKKTRIEYAF